MICERDEQETHKHMKSIKIKGKKNQRSLL